MYPSYPYSIPSYAYYPGPQYGQYPPLPYYVMGYLPLHSPHAADERFRSLQAWDIKDYGKQPFVVNLEQATEQNRNFRTALWTGEHFQVTLMSIPVGSDIGLEVHPNTDQFVRIEEGRALVQMGDTKDQLTYQTTAFEDYAIMIPAGQWHNIINTGNEPLKVYVIYAPPQHPFGTVHATKADAGE